MAGPNTLLIWFAIALIIGLNGFAAGSSAILYLWRPRVRRAARIVTAVLLSGFLPASVLIPVAIASGAFAGGEGPIVFGIGFVAFFALAGAVSLPGALIVARKLEKPGDEFLTFE